MSELRDQGAASSQVTQSATPSSNWKANGEVDPHGDRYACERAKLALGHLTDDELANAVFMGANEPLDIRRMMAEDPDYHAPMALLTAAKDRIRWLSRALDQALEGNAPMEPHHVAQTIAEVAVEQLLKSGAPNYQEFHFDFQVDGEEQVRPVMVTIAFADGPSPHELRLQAEQERDAALAKLEGQQPVSSSGQMCGDLLQRAADMLSSCRGELYRHTVSPHCMEDPLSSSPSLSKLDALRDELLAAVPAQDENGEVS